VGIRARILLAALAVVVTIGGAMAQEKKLSPATESLLLAIRTNDFDAVKRSLLAGADVEAEDADGRTPIDVAIDRGRFNIAHYLLAWRKPPAPTPPTPAAPPPVITETAPAAVPETMPVTREPPSVLPPTPVQPVVQQPLAPTLPATPPPAQIQQPVAPQIATAPPSAIQPAAAPPAAAPAAAPVTPPPGQAKQGGGFFDGIGRFFGFGGKPEAPPEPAAPATAIKPTPAPTQPAPTPVTPLPATGKIAPPAEVTPEEGFLESLARFFSGKSKTGSQPNGAAKPQSSLTTTPSVAESPRAPASPPPAVATVTPKAETPASETAKREAPKAETANAGNPPVRDSLLDHIAKVLAEAQQDNAPPAAADAPTPQPTPPAASRSVPEADPEPLALQAAPAADQQAIRQTATPGAATGDAGAGAPNQIKPAGEPPRQPLAAGTAPAAAPLRSPDAVPVADPEAASVADPEAASAAAPAAAPEGAPVNAPIAAPAAARSQPEAARGDSGAGNLLGRITEFFSVVPTAQPTPEATTPAVETAMAPALKPVAPLRRAAVEPLLGTAHRLGMPRPQASSAVCIDKSALPATFCIEPLDWPTAIAAAFEVQTALYRGRQAIVRYDDGAATQFHASFPTAEFRKIVDYFIAMLGPPGDTPVRSAVVIGDRNRKNRTALWRGPQAAGGDAVLEVREIDDLRWSSPPDLDHGVVRLSRAGSDLIFQHVSWSDFLLARMRRSAK